MRNIFQSFINALNGIKITWLEERNFKIISLVGVLVFLSLFIFNFNVSESVILIAAILFVLTSEILNTAIEDLCNKIEPNTDPVIKKVKDMMAGFTLLSVFMTTILGLYVFYYHFF